jgi:hypothetical protein
MPRGTHRLAAGLAPRAIRLPTEEGRGLEPQTLHQRPHCFRDRSSPIDWFSLQCRRR